MKKTISIRMMEALRRGRKKLGKEAQERLRDYIKSQMIDRAFFMDKSGREDIYYTAFGLMLAYMFGVEVDLETVNLRLRKYDEKGEEKQDLIHYAAFVRCVMLAELLGKHELRMAAKQFFSFGKTIEIPIFATFPHNDRLTPYSRFVELSLKEDTGMKMSGKEQIIESLGDYKIQGGGYSNIAGGCSAATNATVAALFVKGQLAGYEANEDVKSLYDSQTASGGFLAAEQTPLPDLLSTATALFALSSYGVTPKVHAEPFIEAHWLESGGFSATVMEENSDIEYTFYGILALGTC
ncbi:MAG: hypothetical protein LBN71_09995 [Tannerella sp.]|jgi:hypothetical protein|nr:hypothetical protein [Tannerella sp.]